MYYSSYCITHKCCTYNSIFSLFKLHSSYCRLGLAFTQFQRASPRPQSGCDKSSRFAEKKQNSIHFYTLRCDVTFHTWFECFNICLLCGLQLTTHSDWLSSHSTSLLCCCWWKFVSKRGFFVIIDQLHYFTISRGPKWPNISDVRWRICNANIIWLLAVEIYILGNGNV